MWKYGIISLPPKLGRQLLCNYTIYGSNQTILYLIWHNHRATVRQLFVGSCSRVVPVASSQVLQLVSCCFQPAADSLSRIPQSSRYSRSRYFPGLASYGPVHPGEEAMCYYYSNKLRIGEEAQYDYFSYNYWQTEYDKPWL